MTTPTDKSEATTSRFPAVVRACVWLTLALGLAFPLICWGAVQLRGPDAIVATAFAGGICWLAAITSLVVASQFRGPQAMNGVLLGMLFRMAPPLAACLILPAKGEWLVRAGGLEIMVVYYLVTLAVETALSVRLAKIDTINKNESGKSKA